MAISPREYLKQKIKGKSQRSSVARLPSMYADEAAAGALLRAADELRVQQQQLATEQERIDAQLRLRAQDLLVEKPGDWISNPYYTGGFPVWPAIRDIFVEIVESKATLIILRGAAGWGKTALGRLLIFRSMYEVGCYSSPHAAIGQFAPGLPLRISLMAVDKEKASEKLFAPLAGMVRRSGWFSEHFRAQQRLYNNTGINFLALSRPGDKDETLRIVADPTNPDSVIGDDLVAAHLTECNKYDFVEDSKRKHDASVYDAAMEIYDELRVRLITRFYRPHEPCVRVVLDSSERYEGDFLARLTPSLSECGLRYMVYSRSNWETRPNEDKPPYFFFAKPKKGASAEVVEDLERKTYLEDQGREIIQVPEGSEKQNLVFARSRPDDFAQNVVGCPTDAIDRFIGDPEAIRRCKETRERWLADQAIYAMRAGAPERFLLGHSKIDWDVLCAHDDHGVTRPRLLPFEPRYAHFDLATTGNDYVGFAIGCHAGVSGTLPLIYYDMALRIERDGKEYDFSLLRSLLDDFLAHGFRFAEVTFDSWQSFDFGQQLQTKHHLKVERISLHLTVDGYVCMREALYSGRLLIDPGPVLTGELVQLERRVENNREKVGHRPGGHDDVADGVAGVAWQITKCASRASSRMVATTVHVPRILRDVPKTPFNEGAQQAYKAALDRKVEKLLRQRARLLSRDARREAKAGKRH